MNSAPDTLLTDLGRFVSTLECERLPPAMVEKAKACLLYGLGVGVAAVAAPQGRQAARAADRESPGGEGATRLIDGHKLGFPLAAFCNGALLHSRVQDDSHPCGHFGVVVIPAALGCAEQFRATGSELLAALVAGYEVALRIGRDHAVDISTRGFRTTPVYGVFAAAACGARLMKLDPVKSAHALALAANTASGLREWLDAGSEELPFQAGLAARNGLVCANLAASGAIGALGMLTGGAGFYRAFGRDGERYAQRVLTDLGTVFEFDNVEYKPYPISQFVRAVVRGVLALRERANGRAVAEISAHMHPFEADFRGNRYAGPFTSFTQALASTPFCAALAWASGQVSFAGLHDFACAPVLHLLPKVRIIADAARPRYAPRIVAQLADGALLDRTETAGTDHYRLTWNVALEMNSKLAAEVGIPQNASRALEASVAGIDRADDVRELVAAAVRCAGAAPR